MERENCSTTDILADIWGPLSPRKRKSGQGSDFSPKKSPRHGNVPGKRIPLSPSKFNIEANVAEENAKRKVSRSLFDTEIVPEQLKSIRNKTVKIETPRKARPARDDLYGQIKAALSLECPDQLLGRETEHEQILKFIQNAIQSETGRGLYISGQPGTGKSATINNVLKKLKVHNPGMSFLIAPIH